MNHGVGGRKCYLSLSFIPYFIVESSSLSDHHMTVSFSVIFPNKKLTKKRSLSLSFTFLASFLATRAFLPLLGFFDPFLSFLRDSFSLSFSEPKVAFFSPFSLCGRFHQVGVFGSSSLCVCVVVFFSALMGC